MGGYTIYLPQFPTDICLFPSKPWPIHYFKRLGGVVKNYAGIEAGRGGENFTDIIPLVWIQLLRFYSMRKYCLCRLLKLRFNTCVYKQISCKLVAEVAYIFEVHISTFCFIVVKVPGISLSYPSCFHNTFLFNFIVGDTVFLSHVYQT